MEVLVNYSHYKEPSEKVQDITQRQIKYQKIRTKT